jgi:Spy/CpxP family protein refolding chaperone
MRASRWLMAGLFVASTVMVVSAQQPGRQFGGGGKGGLTGQVTNNVALQEELKLSDDQKSKLKAAAEKAGASIKEAFKDAGGDKEKIGALFTKMAEDSAKLVNETLTAEQKVRLKQIERQLSGVRAFGNDEMVADLKLEDGQKTKIKGIVDEYSKDVRELGGFGGFGKGGFDKEKAAEAAKKREKLEKGALADIDEVLNDSQRKTWKELNGAPVADIAKVRAGAFGGFGGTGGFGNKGKTTPKKD